MILPNGKIYQKHCGVTTGFEYTAGQNTDIHNVAFIASIASSKIDFNSVNAKMYGDDNKGYYDPDVKHPFNFDGFRTGMKIFGYSLTDIEDRDDYQDVTFLQVQPRHYDNAWRPTRVKSHLVAKLRHCNIGSSVWDGLSQSRLYGILISYAYEGFWGRDSP